VSVAPTSAAPLIVGFVLFTGAFGFPATVPVGSEVSVEEPSLFFAVTRTRIRRPSSADVSLNVLLDAPLIERQFPPPPPQRRHWYSKVMGVDPDQLPVDALSVCPTAAVPEIVGGDVLVGAAWVEATIPEAPLSAVSAELATATARYPRMRLIVILRGRWDPSSLI
jgi:hypothetical protein